MHRRQFLKQTLLTAGSLSWAAEATGAQAGSPMTTHTFKLNYAPHFGMFEASAGADLFDQLRFMADAGFRALEDNGLMKRPPEVQQRIGDTLSKLGMTMGVFVIDTGDNWKPSLATGKREFRDKFVATCRQAVEVAARCGARWMTVVPGFFERSVPIGIQTGHVIDVLRAGADVLAPHELVMVLEPLSDTPELFLRTSDQTYAICRAVNSPACKILFDIYHMQRNEGHLIPHIDLVWDEIAYFQIGDVPGRKEPGTGEINYRNVFRHIHAKAAQGGRTFVFGMEHGNAEPGQEGERKLIEAYVRADDF